MTKPTQQEYYYYPKSGVCIQKSVAESGLAQEIKTYLVDIIKKLEKAKKVLDKSDFRTKYPLENIDLNFAVDHLVEIYRQNLYGFFSHLSSGEAISIRFLTPPTLNFAERILDNKYGLRELRTDHEGRRQDFLPDGIFWKVFEVEFDHVNFTLVEREAHQSVTFSSDGTNHYSSIGKGKFIVVPELKRIFTIDQSQLMVFVPQQEPVPASA